MKSMFDEQDTFRFIAARLAEVERERFPDAEPIGRSNAPKRRVDPLDFRSLGVVFVDLDGSRLDRDPHEKEPIEDHVVRMYDWNIDPVDPTVWPNMPAGSVQIRERVWRLPCGKLVRPVPPPDAPPLPRGFRFV